MVYIEVNLPDLVPADFVIFFLRFDAGDTVLLLVLLPDFCLFDKLAFWYFFGFLLCLTNETIFILKVLYNKVSLTINTLLGYYLHIFVHMIEFKNANNIKILISFT